MGLLSRFKQKKESSDSHDNGEFRSRSEEDSIVSRSRGKKTENTRKSKANDPVLPEKKRARRRLIGATALALAAIIGLPMVFDSEPKPLPDDITIRIPSKDKAQEADTAKPAEPAPPRKANLMDVDPGEEIIDPVTPVTIPANPAVNKTTNVVADNRVIAPINATTQKVTRPDAAAMSKVDINPDEASKLKSADVKVNAKLDSKIEKKSESKSEPKAQTKPDAKPESKSDTKSDIRPEAKSDVKTDVVKPAKQTNEDDAARAMAILEGKAPAKTASKAQDSEHASYVVQVAALATQEKVDELQSKLKAANIKSYTQKVATSSGDKIRIRVGPFESKEEADKMRAKLAKLGLNGSLVPN